MDTRWKSVEDQFRKIEERFTMIESRMEKNEQETKERFDSLASSRNELFEWLKKEIGDHGILEPVPVITVQPPSGGIKKTTKTTTEMTTKTSPEEVLPWGPPRRESTNKLLDEIVNSNKQILEFLKKEASNKGLLGPVPISSSSGAGTEIVNSPTVEEVPMMVHNRREAFPNQRLDFSTFFDGNPRMLIEEINHLKQLKNVKVKEQMNNDRNVQVGDFVSEKEVGMFMSPCVEVTASSIVVLDDEESHVIKNSCRVNSESNNEVVEDFSKCERENQVDNKEDLGLGPGINVKEVKVDGTFLIKSNSHRLDEDLCEGKDEFICVDQKLKMACHKKMFMCFPQQSWQFFRDNDNKDVAANSVGNDDLIRIIILVYDPGKLARLLNVNIEDTSQGKFMDAWCSMFIDNACIWLKKVNMRLVSNKAVTESCGWWNKEVKATENFLLEQCWKEGATFGEIVQNWIDSSENIRLKKFKVVRENAEVKCRASLDWYLSQVMRLDDGFILGNFQTVESSWVEEVEGQQDGFKFCHYLAETLAQSKGIMVKNFIKKFELLKAMRDSRTKGLDDLQVNCLERLVTISLSKEDEAQIVEFQGDLLLHESWDPGGFEAVIANNIDKLHSEADHNLHNSSVGGVVDDELSSWMQKHGLQIFGKLQEIVRVFPFVVLLEQFGQQTVELVLVGRFCCLLFINEETEKCLMLVKTVPEDFESFLVVAATGFGDPCKLDSFGSFVQVVTAKMEFKTVYQCLTDVFPQIDTRLLRAVAIEHPKDIDTVVEVVLSEILPFTETNFVIFNPPSIINSPSDLLDGGADNKETLALKHRRSGLGRVHEYSSTPRIVIGEHRNSFGDTIATDYLQLLEGLKRALIAFIQLWVNASAVIPTVYSSATMAETISTSLQLWEFLRDASATILTAYSSITMADTISTSLQLWELLREHTASSTIVNISEASLQRSGGVVTKPPPPRLQVLRSDLRSISTRSCLKQDFLTLEDNCALKGESLSRTIHRTAGVRD